MTEAEMIEAKFHKDCLSDNVPVVNPWAKFPAIDEARKDAREALSSLDGAVRERREARVQRGEELHLDTAHTLGAFHRALREKLLAAQRKYQRGNDWATDDWEAECRAELRRHMDKGDPLDVAAYAMFCWARGWSTSNDR